LWLYYKEETAITYAYKRGGDLSACIAFSKPPGKHALALNNIEFLGTLYQPQTQFGI
jgi:hypothetical protein